MSEENQISNPKEAQSRPMDTSISSYPGKAWLHLLHVFQARSKRRKDNPLWTHDKSQKERNNL